MPTTTAILALTATLCQAPDPVPAERGLRLSRLRVVAAFADRGGDADASGAERSSTDYREQQIERALRDAVAWWFHHSRYRLFVDLAVVRSRAAGTVPCPTDGPRAAALERLAAAAGRSSAAVSLFVVVAPPGPSGEPVDEARTPGRRELAGGDGGRAVAWWTARRPPERNGWLMCCELYRHVDALLARVGGAPAGSTSLPRSRVACAPGLDWEVVRAALRAVPETRWAGLPGSEAMWVRDRDQDGLPDRDPRLPLDEERFGCLPDRADTDGDSLSDKQEALLGWWLIESGFESQLGPRLVPNPRTDDTDADLLPDAVDPLPLFAFTPTLSAGRWLPLRSLVDPRGTLATELRVHDGRLELRTESGEGAALQVRILLDRDDDGFGIGTGDLLVRTRGDTCREVVRCGVAGAVGPAPTASVHEDGDTVSIVRIAPSRPLSADTAFGLSIAYRTRLHDDDQSWLTVFEPHRLIRFDVR